MGFYPGASFFDVSISHLLGCWCSGRRFQVRHWRLSCWFALLLPFPTHCLITSQWSLTLSWWHRWSSELSQTVERHLWLRCSTGCFCHRHRRIQSRYWFTPLSHLFPIFSLFSFCQFSCYLAGDIAGPTSSHKEWTATTDSGVQSPAAGSNGYEAI